VALADGVAAVDGAWQEKNCFLNIGGEAEEIHDLGDARALEGNPENLAALEESKWEIGIEGR